jgi:ATP-dependent Clp protease, protease subunit
MTRSWYLDEDDEPKKDDAAGSRNSSFIDQKLFGSRYIVLTGPITMDLARGVSERLLAMAAEDSAKPIHLLINSPGGHVESGDTIFDMIRFIEAPVKVIGSGWVASAAAHIYLAVSRENRYSLPNTRFLLHQPSGGAGGPASDIAIQAKEIIKTKQRINRVIAEQTGQPLERVTRDTERDYWMSAEEALAYGMVGQVITSVREISAT